MIYQIFMSLLNTTFTVGDVLDSRYEILEVSELTEKTARIKAIDLHLDKYPVILKIFHLDDSTTRKDLERFRAEVIITRKLSHPNIEAVYDIGRFESDFLYISSQEIEGIPLTHLIKNHSSEKISFKIAVELTYQLLHAVQTAHAKGIIHRNIIPENIVVTASRNRLQNVTLRNFGLGKLFEKDLGLTKTGERVIIASVYQSPEQIRGEVIDERSDLYSLGGVLSEFISGTSLNGADKKNNNALEIFTSNQLPDLRATRKDLPAWFIELIEFLTVKNKNERISSAKEAGTFILNHLGYKSKQLHLSKKKSRLSYFFNSIFGFQVRPLITKTSMSFGLALFGILLAGIPVYWFTHQSVSESVTKEKDHALLFEAVASGNETDVLKLLSKGISPEIYDSEGTPLLFYAIRQNNNSIAYTLLSNAPEILNMQDLAGKTAIHYAEQNNNQELVSILHKFSTEYARIILD